MKLCKQLEKPAPTSERNVIRYYWMRRDSYQKTFFGAGVYYFKRILLISDKISPKVHPASYKTNVCDSDGS